VLFVAMGVIWGVPYLLIKVAVEELEPSVLVLGRTLLAGLLLLPVAIARGHLRGLRSAWLPILVFALEEGTIGRAARGERVGTIIQSHETATEGASR